MQLIFLCRKQDIEMQGVTCSRPNIGLLLQCN